MNAFSIPRSRAGHAFLSVLTDHAERIMQRPPDEIIGDRYMRRWHAVRTPIFCEYIHLYVGDDPIECLHDHPWPSASICLRGALQETTSIAGDTCELSRITPGTVSVRSARFSHRLQLVTGPAVTLFLTGPRIRDWGWHLPTGWRHWKEVSRVDPDGVTRVSFAAKEHPP